MARGTKVDYAPIKREFITTYPSISIRALAAKHEISWSALNARKNKEGWEKQRDEFQSKRDEKTVERLADRAASETNEIRDEMLLVLRAAIRKFGLDLREGKVSVTAGDIAKLIPQINLLIGEPTTRTEAQVFGVQISSQVDPELLRRVVEVARGAAGPGNSGKLAELVPPRVGAD